MKVVLLQESILCLFLLILIDRRCLGLSPQFLLSKRLLFKQDKFQSSTSITRRPLQPIPFFRNTRTKGLDDFVSRSPRRVRDTHELTRGQNMQMISSNDGIIDKRDYKIPVRRILLNFATFVIILTSAWRLPARAAIEATKGGVGTATASTLGVKNLMTAAMMLVSLAGIPLAVKGRTPALSKSLLVSASRCAAQVLFLGSVLLQRIMGTSQPFLVLAWILGVGVIAGGETYSRAQYIYPSMKRHIYGSILLGGALVLALSLTLNVLGDIYPWYKPGVWIPIAGMLFGNTLSASALATSTITKAFATRQGEVELLLTRGATYEEATLPLVRDALYTALTPTINGLAVTGIVHIPGMMSGQILSGQPPTQAAAYQIMINFLIATTACTTVQLILRSAVGALVDSRNHRLYPNQLKSMQAVKQGDWQVELALSPVARAEPKQVTVRPLRAPALTTVDDNCEHPTTLEARDLLVSRANARISFQCKPGYRIGISGKSGVGKSQIVRTLAQLEEWKEGELLFRGQPAKNLSKPRYRAHVCLVPQNINIVEGTPSMFYDQIIQLSHQLDTLEQESSRQRFLDFLEQMGLENSIIERQWTTLSGGEAQRVSLAIAICLNPDVLLLDESTSALDISTCKQVEKVLVDSGVPIVIVTHSQDQLERFCTHRMDL